MNPGVFFFASLLTLFYFVALLFVLFGIREWTKAHAQVAQLQSRQLQIMQDTLNRMEKIALKDR